MSAIPAGWVLDTREGWSAHYWRWHYWRGGHTLCGKFEKRIWGKPRRNGRPVLDAPPEGEQVCDDCRSAGVAQPG